MNKYENIQIITASSMGVNFIIPIGTVWSPKSSYRHGLVYSPDVGGWPITFDGNSVQNNPEIFKEHNQ